MVVKNPRIVIIGAGMAGLTAASKLYKSGGKNGAFEVCVVEGGNRIGGRINTSEFGGDRIEMGATWIHGINGSPLHQIAQEINSLESDQPWECMDGFLDNPITIDENGVVFNPSLVNPITNLYKNLIAFAEGKRQSIGDGIEIDMNGNRIEKRSVGSFLREGLDAYWKFESRKGGNEVNENKKILEEAIFTMYENLRRAYSATNDLFNIDFEEEGKYVMFPGKEITIAKGYSSIIESLASILPSGAIQLGKKVCKIEWKPLGLMENGHGGTRPVKLHFLDGTTMAADNVIVTVSLGVLKAGISNDNNSGIFEFDPPLPNNKIEAISRIGYGLVNKLFLQLSPDFLGDVHKFPNLQLIFLKKSDLEVKNSKIPLWMRKTASLAPIYAKSSVLLSWIAGDEALELEALPDEVILEEVSSTMSSFLSNSTSLFSNSNEECIESKLKFVKVLKSQWGNDPLFKGSYSYITVGSSSEDMDTLAEPLPRESSIESTTGTAPPLQILFAGEATHRTHYSTTHGAYFSGLREANRLLHHYHCIDV